MRVDAVGLADDVAVSQDTVTSPAGVFTRPNLGTAVLLALGAVLSFIVFNRVVALPIRTASNYSYFAQQADAWLHLRWDIVNPTSHTDIIVQHGKYYSIYGPFPAVLMLPLVAIFGRTVNDILFCMFVSGINLGLLFLLFEQLRASGLTHRDWRENVVWSVFLYMGSTAFFLSLTGGVWYTGHIVACTCLLAALLLAFRRHFVWSAVALSCGFLSRSTLLFGFPFLFYMAWQDGGAAHLVEAFFLSARAGHPDWSAVPWRRLGGVLGVLVACLGAYMLRNWGMFGNPLETGYELLRVQHYAAVTNANFSLSYIPSNLVNDFFNFPRIVYPNSYSTHPSIDLDGQRMGICVFLTTPLFLLLFLRNRGRSVLRIALWASVLLCMAFTLAYYSAGFPQFGTRYLFDIYPFAWILLAISDVRMDWRVVVLGVWGILFNLAGDLQYWTNPLFR